MSIESLIHFFQETFILREFLYQPLYNALVWLYDTVALQDLGLAIILLTVLVRLILYPLFHKTAKYQQLNQELRPELQKIKEKHKKDQEAQVKATLELFRQHKFNPAALMFLSLAQVPILFALYVIFIGNIAQGLDLWLYSFTPRPEEFHQTFFGLVDLTKASAVIAVLASLAQYFQARLTPAIAGAPGMKVIMLYFLPGLILVFLLKFPAAVGLYWLTTTIFSIMQQVVVNRRFTKTPPPMPVGARKS